VADEYGDPKPVRQQWAPLNRELGGGDKGGVRKEGISGLFFWQRQYRRKLVLKGKHTAEVKASKCGGEEGGVKRKKAGKDVIYGKRKKFA